MKVILLTKGRQTLVDDIDYPELSKYKWQFNNGYAIRNTGPRANRRKIYLHRSLFHSIPQGKIIDHKDRDKLNNQRTNLRLATRGQNAVNTINRRNNKTGFSNASWDKRLKKYKATYTYNQKEVYLGLYENPQVENFW